MMVLVLAMAIAPATPQGNSPAEECGGAGNFLVKFDWNETTESWDVEGDNPSEITLSDVEFDEDGEPVSFDWSETTATVGTVIVFGGNSVEEYGTSDQDDLTAPLNTNTPAEDDTYAISHITFCAGSAPQTPEPSEPAPQTPEPSEPAPQTPEPSEPAPQTPEPSEPAPQTVEPTDGPTEVLGVVIERPAPEPAPEPDVVAEPEPAPEVLAEELPRTGTENLRLAGLAMMLIGAGLLLLARAGRTERITLDR